MTKTLATSVILALTVVAGLSACTLQVREPSSSSTPVESGTPTPTPTATSDSVGGAFTTGDCEGKDISIEDDATTVVFSGECGDVTVSADGATVSLDAATSITVTGQQNTIIVQGRVASVSLQGDQNSVTGGDADTVDLASNGNQVTLNTTQAVTLSGSDNFIVWSEGAASANDSGTGNVVLAP